MCLTSLDPILLNTERGYKKLIFDLTQDLKNEKNITQRDLELDDQIQKLDNNCWYCKKRNSVKEFFAEIELYKTVDREWKYAVTAITWKTSFIKTKSLIPRCKNCKNYHDGIILLILFIGFTLGLVGSIILIVSPQFLNLSPNLSNFFRILWLLIQLFFGSFVIAGLVYFILSFFFKTEKYGEEHPKVKKLIEDGWEIGSEPPYKE